jgi:hypothetical protein
MRRALTSVANAPTGTRLMSGGGMQGARLEEEIAEMNKYRPLLHTRASSRDGGKRASRNGA